MDNICILNYAIEKEMQKKEGKVHTFFVDLKAAFDIVNREIMDNNEEKRNI